MRYIVLKTASILTTAKIFSTHVGLCLLLVDEIGPYSNNVADSSQLLE